ncbi:MAG: DUF4261 domain-containing protein [Phycisphaerales bacterium]|nr:DUF4261 domain-containing protein [Phycisphaerales bacterium]
MIWVVLFVILGAMTLVATLYGLIAAWRDRRSLVAMHLVALVLVIVAWGMGHVDFVGRMSLAAAMVLEAIAWLGIRHEAPAQSVVPMRRRGGATPTYSAEPIYETDIPATAEPIYDDSHPDPASIEPMAPLDAPEPDEATAIVASPDPAPDAPADVPQAPAGPADPPPTIIPPSPAPSLQQRANVGVEICIRTFALLSRPYNVTLSVLLASMKRAGLRQAKLIEPDDENAPSYIQVDALKVGLVVEDAPVPSRTIESALGQTGLDEHSADAIRQHAAHIAVDVAYDTQTLRIDAVLTAMRAQAALMEFAPVIAVVWPEAANIIPAVDAGAYIDAATSDASRVTDICASERRFELDGPNAGLRLLDSIGLAAFGLPDAQVVVAEADEAHGVSALRALSRHLMERGCDLPDGGHHTLDDGSCWRVTYTRSAFDPDREVVQIRPDAAGTAERDNASDDSDNA